MKTTLIFVVFALASSMVEVAIAQGEISVVTGEITKSTISGPGESTSEPSTPPGAADGATTVLFGETTGGTITPPGAADGATTVLFGGTTEGIIPGPAEPIRKPSTPPGETTEGHSTPPTGTSGKHSSKPTGPSGNKVSVPSSPSTTYGFLMFVRDSILSCIHTIQKIGRVFDGLLKYKFSGTASGKRTTLSGVTNKGYTTLPMGNIEVSTKKSVGRVFNGQRKHINPGKASGKMTTLSGVTNKWHTILSVGNIEVSTNKYVGTIKGYSTLLERIIGVTATFSGGTTEGYTRPKDIIEGTETQSVSSGSHVEPTKLSLLPTETSDLSEYKPPKEGHCTNCNPKKHNLLKDLIELPFKIVRNIISGTGRLIYNIISFPGKIFSSKKSHPHMANCKHCKD